MKKIFFLAVVSFSLVGILNAQETLKFSAQIRPRFEIDNKDFNSSTLQNTFTLLRTRVGLAFTPLKNISGFFQIQDSRTFGQEPSTVADTKNLDLHQAFFKIDNLFDLPVNLKLGRTEISYGSERFIGSLNWSNVGRSFDGGIASVLFENILVDVFALKEFERSNAGDSLDQSIYGINVDIGGLSGHTIQPFIIWQRESPTDYLSRFTLGTYYKGIIENFTHEIDAAYQLGNIIASNRKQDISAYVFSYNANYTFDIEAKPSVGLQIDYTSGDDNQFDDKFKTFASLYGTGHKFFGHMDYFVNLVNDTYGLGVTDFVGKLGLSPVSQLMLNLNFHIFRANENYYLINSSTSKDFGSELDFVANYKYNNNISFEGGAAFFSPGDIFKERRGSDTSTWFYLMAIANF